MPLFLAMTVLLLKICKDKIIFVFLTISIVLVFIVNCRFKNKTSLRKEVGAKWKCGDINIERAMVHSLYGPQNRIEKENMKMGKEKYREKQGKTKSKNRNQRRLRDPQNTSGI